MRESVKCCQTEVFLRSIWKRSCKVKSLEQSTVESRFSIKMASHGDALMVRSSTILFEVLSKIMSLSVIQPIIDMEIVMDVMGDGFPSTLIV